MFALGEDVSSKAVAWLGHISVVAASLVGVLVTLSRSAPVYGGVIAWALMVVASGLGQRIKDTEKEDDCNRVGVYGAARQRTLSYFGALVNVAAVIYATVSD